MWIALGDGAGDDEFAALLAAALRGASAPVERIGTLSSER
jgi:hypothetical protein